MQNLTKAAVLACLLVVGVGIVGCGVKDEATNVPPPPKDNMPAKKASGSQQQKMIAAPPGVETGTQ